MKKEEIVNKLVESHWAFIDYLLALESEKFSMSNNGNWTPEEQLRHIHLCVKPLSHILRISPWLLTRTFGIGEQAGISFESFTQRYFLRLKGGIVSPQAYKPENYFGLSREKLVLRLTSTIKKLLRRINKLSERDLDMLILPHPLLGKITLREMLYFTIYHVHHHHAATKANLEQYLFVSEIQK